MARVGQASFQLDPRSLLRFKQNVRQVARGMGVDSQTALRVVMRGVVMNLSSWTPPRSKARGEETIDRDVKRAVGARPHYIIRSMLKSKRPFLPKPAADLGAVTIEHKAARNARGVVPRGYRQRLVATEGMRTTEYERAIRRVGRLKAGWNAAASTFRVRVASWVWRHGTQEGRATDAITPRLRGYLEAVNEVPYIGRQAGIANRALRVATRKTVEKMNKMIAKNAAKFNRG